MTTLITGIAGFVGDHLARRLRDSGEEVVGLDRAGPSPVDLLDPQAVRALVERTRPSVVFHLAGALRAADVRTFYDSNVGGTAILLEALAGLKERPRAVIVASSSAVYGNPKSDAPITEDDELLPITHYGASKAAQELVARRASAADGLKVIVARVFNIIGPGQPSTLAAGAFAERVARAERSAEHVLKVGNLAGERDFVDVRDVAAAYVALARAGRPGTTYNVCSGQLIPLSRCVEELKRFARVPLEVKHEEALRQANDVRAQRGDASRIKKDTGWAPEVGFERSIEDLLSSWRQKVTPTGGET